MTGKSIRKEDAPAAWNLKEIREILDLLNEQGISEFELENNGFRVRIKRGSGAPAAFEGQPPATAAVQTPHFGIVHPVQPAPHPAPSPSRIIDPGASAEVAAQPHDGLYIIKSPIVGTFYASPGPEAPPFVKVGDDVQPGKVLCIIEAMKLMNEIEAEVTGEIAKVFVESGKPVEYGQALFGLIPAAP